MTHPADAREFAINASNERFWEPPVKRYVAECLAGKAGPRGEDFNMRWIASLVGRGAPHPDARRRCSCIRSDTQGAGQARTAASAVRGQSDGHDRRAGRRRAPARGASACWRSQPTALHQRVPVILGSRNEVERIARYHREHDAGVDQPFSSPLFNTRSLFTHG